MDRDQSWKHERAQIGHGWSVRSPFQTTPPPSAQLSSDSTFYRPFSLSLAYHLLFYIYVFLCRIGRRYRSLFVPAHPLSIDLSYSNTYPCVPCATLSRSAPPFAAGLAIYLST